MQCCSKRLKAWGLEYLCLSGSNNQVFYFFFYLLTETETVLQKVLLLILLKLGQWRKFKTANDSKKS